MSTERMTSRERILATLRQDEVDRFPVWLKMVNNTWLSSQPEAVRAMDGAELLEAAGCDVMVGLGLGMTIERPHVELDVDDRGDRKTTVFKTPDGDLVETVLLDPYTGSWHPHKYPIETVDDLKRARWIFTDTTHTPDLEKATIHAQRQDEIAAAGHVSQSGCGPSPWMDVIEHWAGPVNAIYLESDAPEAMGELLDAMHRDRLRHLDAMLPHLKSDTFWVSENTSTTLISPAQFDRYCKPMLSDYFTKVAERGIVPVAHMCGHLNALLESIDTMPHTVNEAYTTRPVGNVSMAEGRTRMPSKAIIGGTNATLWLSDPETIVAQVAEDLDACPDRRGIFLTSAGVLPPPVSLEKARTVVEKLKQLPVNRS
jgi:hypothetical protein